MHFCIFKVWLCAHMWQVISFCIGIAVMIPSIQETEILSDYVKCICFKSRNISLSNITGGSYIEESVIIDDQVKLFILIYAGIFLDEELSYSPLFKPAYLSWLLYSWHFGCCTLQLFQISVSVILNNLDRILNWTLYSVRVYCFHSTFYTLEIFHIS